MDSSNPGPVDRATAGGHPPRPSEPRLQHYWTDGTAVSASADVAFGDHAREHYPQITVLAQKRLNWRARAVRVLVGEHGIGQLLVAGTDFPSRDEVHDVAVDLRVRTPAKVKALLTGTELVPPGVVTASAWPDGMAGGPIDLCCGLGRVQAGAGARAGAR